ncbi:MAG: putative maltokinase [Spirosomataceae bacterium]
MNLKLNKSKSNSKGFDLNATLIESLETTLLPPYFNQCRWFAGKARSQDKFLVKVTFEVPCVVGVPTDHGEGTHDAATSYLLIVEVSYHDGEPESYLLPLSFVSEQDIPAKGIISEAVLDEQEGLLVDGIYDVQFRSALFRLLSTNERLAQPTGDLSFLRGKGLDIEDVGQELPNRVLPVDSSNSAMIFGDKYFMKLYRKLFRETNPEVDMVAFITEYSTFQHIPAFAGSLTWKRSGAPDVTLGMMQRAIRNQNDAWRTTGDYLNDFLYGVPNRIFAINEDVFEQVVLLGKRTAEMHLALYAPHTNDGAFAPERFNDEYRQFLVGRFSNLLERRYNLLVDNYLQLDAPTQKLAWVFMEAKEMIDEFTQEILHRPLDSLRIRIHGDYHLGQVLATDSDYIVIDFEGEPESSITERKIKHSPLKDVAGMVRSYHYAVAAKLFNSAETESMDAEKLQIVSDRWFKLIRDTYLDAYFDTFGYPHDLFKSNNEINFLLLLYLLEKAVYELGYEISYRPSWVKIPLKGIVDVVREIEKVLREK